MNDFSTLVISIPLFLIALASGIWNGELENRIVNYLKIAHPDIWASQNMEQIFVDDERFLKKRRLFYSRSHPLRLADPILDRLCRWKLVANRAMFLAMSFAIFFTLIAGFRMAGDITR